MANWDDVTRVAERLPQTHLNGAPGFRKWSIIDGKDLAWERPLRTGEIKRQLADGQPVPTGDIIAFHVPGVEAKLAYLQMEPLKYFEIPHFAGYPAVLAHLAELTEADLSELLYEAFLVKAPKKLLSLLD